MPAMDGTGPMGLGPMSGRRFGYGCEAYNRLNQFKRPSLGCRRVFGNGGGRFFNTYNLDKETRQALLVEQKNILEKELKNIKSQLEEL